MTTPTPTLVKDLQPDDRVELESGKWTTVKEIHPFGRGAKWIVLSNGDSGAMANKDDGE